MKGIQTFDGRLDRRRARRRQTIDDHGIVSARVRPGWEVSLIDVSAGGALVETSYRLLPGSRVVLHVSTTDRRVSVRGGVLRSTVVAVQATAMCYRCAIGFDHVLSWLVDHESSGYGVPAAEARDVANLG